MRLVRYIRNQILLTAFVCGVGYVAYQVLLDDEAKEGLRSLASTVSNSYGELTGLVNDRIGTIMDEDLVQQNRRNIREAWENLGF